MVSESNVPRIPAAASTDRIVDPPSTTTPDRISRRFSCHATTDPDTRRTVANFYDDLARSPGAIFTLKI